MFGRRMKTKLPETRKREKRETEIRERHDEAKLKQKTYVDGKKGTREKKLKLGDKILLQRKKTTTKSPWDPVPYEVEQIKGSEITARRGEEVKRRAKNNVKPVKPRPQFFQAPQRMKVKNKEEEDLEGDINKILGRKVPETQEVGNRKEQLDMEAMGTDDRIQGGEELENQPLHITVEVSTDEESENQVEEELQTEEEVGDQEAEGTVESEETPSTSMTTRAGRKTRKPRRFREEGQVQLSPKERSRRKSRAKFKKFRAEN